MTVVGPLCVTEVFVFPLYGGTVRTLWCVYISENPSHCGDLHVLCIGRHTRGFISFTGTCVPQGEWSKVPEGESFNVFPSISLLTLDVMLRCTCSYDSHCQTNKSVSLSISPLPSSSLPAGHTTLTSSLSLTSPPSPPEEFCEHLSPLLSDFATPTPSRTHTHKSLSALTPCIAVTSLSLSLSLLKVFPCLL